MPRGDALQAVGAKLAGKLTGEDWTPEQEAAAEAELDEDRRQRLEQQKDMGKFLFFLALASFYFLWLQDIVPPHLDFAARKLGYARFLRVGDLKDFFDGSGG
eukprot:CAMPEP_0119274334 /NCGR_PEP_ID=MMETSP1329-20130426/11896_1 /TAXON_ID=114041 /ORGANISM="Genus nov. species nov., Strain RCC1024" /LENGTH=101 /DNA_ID=CAMNT_0007274639 /DNA_START=74 /DNA_END=375 /DNA_ORIENTATION=-